MVRWDLSLPQSTLRPKALTQFPMNINTRKVITDHFMGSYNIINYIPPFNEITLTQRNYLTLAIMVAVMALEIVLTKILHTLIGLNSCTLHAPGTLGISTTVV